MSTSSADPKVQDSHTHHENVKDIEIILDLASSTLMHKLHSTMQSPGLTAPGAESSPRHLTF